MEATAFILAGGLSTRMRQDKALLRLGNRTLLEHAIALAKAAIGDARLVGDRSRLSPFGIVIEDVYEGCGPLGGIHAALRSSSTELNLILAVDTPFLKPQFLSALLVKANDSPAVAVVPRIGGKFEPLCAVYRRRFADAAEAALTMGKYKIDALFSQVEVEIIDETALASMGAAPEDFVNLNTPEQWQRAQQQFAAMAN